jgi:hypothetical protein
VRWSQNAQGAARLAANSGTSIIAARRTGRNAARGIEFDVRGQVVRIGKRIPGFFALFERELVGRRINLPKVIDASVALGGSASFYEVWNGDRGEQANDGYDNHNFHQRETSIAEAFIRLHFVLLAA